MKLGLIFFGLNIVWTFSWPCPVFIDQKICFYYRQTLL